MASTGKLTRLTLLVVCMLMITAPHSEAAISCSTVMSSVYPCYNYVTKGGKVPVACCNGIKSLNNVAKTKGDRQSVCSCIKSVGAGVKGTIFDRVASLPGKCGVKLPFKITPNVDCSKIRKQ